MHCITHYQSLHFFTDFIVNLKLQEWKTVLCCRYKTSKNKNLILDISSNGMGVYTVFTEFYPPLSYERN